MKGLSEKQIENMILNWLEWKGIYAWKTKTTGTYSVKRGCFISGSRLYRKGVADVVGLLPDKSGCPSGRLLAIEVKTQKGILQENQKTFLKEIESRGGLAFVARSIEDVEEALKDYL